MRGKTTETHKQVTALDKGEGLTYLGGENQQAAHWPPATWGTLCKYRWQWLHTTREVIMAIGHAGRVFDMLEWVTRGRSSKFEKLLVWMLQWTDDSLWPFCTYMGLLVCKRVLFPENNQSEKDTSKVQENHGIKGAATWEKSHSAVRTRTRNIKK